MKHLFVSFFAFLELVSPSAETLFREVGGGGEGLNFKIML